MALKVDSQKLYFKNLMCQQEAINTHPYAREKTLAATKMLTLSWWSILFIGLNHPPSSFPRGTCVRDIKPNT